jgi:hypothetical protein
MNNRVFLTTVTMLFLPGGALLAQPASTVDRHHLEGTWEVKAFPQGAPTTIPPIVVNLCLYTQGGGLNFINLPGSAGPLPPPVASFATDQSTTLVGEWVPLGDGRFQLIAYAILTKNGVTAGYFRLTSTITLSATGNEYTGPGQADFYDANWNLVFTSMSDAYGRRLLTPELRGQALSAPAQKPSALPGPIYAALRRTP